MNIAKITPIINTVQLEAVKSFYQRHFDFRVVFEGAGYLALKAPDGGAELAFMVPGNGERHFGGDGLTLTFEVANVDQEHERLVAAGLTIVQPPKDNPWGDRSVIVRDPAGVWLYLCHRIPISPEMQRFLRE